MKIGVVGDIHWSRYSSILRQRGIHYSFRLENCIQSINWAEELIGNENCSMVVYLGDFFDSPELNAEEVTALKDIKWNKLEHFFLVGNHEMGINDLSYSTSHVFEYIDMNGGSNVIDCPRSIEVSNARLNFVPYILEDQRKPFSNYISKTDGKRTIVFSHNDISGIQMGNFISKTGFGIDEIEQNCDLFLNGHLHNGSKITDKIINVGNLTGQNFGENAFLYDHCVFVLDTDTLTCALYENPYAINFYKVDTTEASFDVATIKNNAVVTLKTLPEYQTKYKEMLDDSEKVIVSRIILAPSKVKDEPINDSKEIFSVNHLNKFSEYILENLGRTEVVIEELSEVLK